MNCNRSFPGSRLACDRAVSGKEHFLIPAGADSFLRRNMNEARHIITEIQSLGVRMEAGGSARKGGAGPAEGRALIIGGVAVNVPVSSGFVHDSPYSLLPLEDAYLLCRHGKELCPVEVTPEPAFYDLATDDGISYRKLALLHGRDCLATTVLQRCANWSAGKRCMFCGTELSLTGGQTVETKSPGQLAEAAAAAKKLDSVTHVVLTSGAGDPPGSEIDHLAACAKAIKQATGLPIQVQFLPPPDLDALHLLKEAGVDTVGIHIESFDEDVLARTAPAKAVIGLKGYQRAWAEAVELFGPNQVSSFLVAGLGEDASSIVRGSEHLADTGVFPFVVPLRPIPGSLMEKRLPPRPEIMTEVYEAVAEILRQNDLASKKSLAGCIRCGACSALQCYEREKEKLVCHSARTKTELERAFQIRHEVFVLEQKIFQDSDRDRYDPKSIHLVAKMEDEVVGAVRLFPSGSNGNGCWYGGRLAVTKEHRASHAGELLVREAVKRARRLNCKTFLAHIQETNVPFFTRLGWKPVGEIEEYMGKPHQLMQADLNGVHED